MSNVIISLSSRMARVIHEANPEETSCSERLAAIIALQFINYGVIVVSLGVGAATGAFWGTALSVFTFAVIRMLTGGLHFKSLDVCFLASTTVLSLIPHLLIPAWMPTVVALILLYVFSRKRKLIPILILGANLFIGSPIIALAALAQSFTLIGRR